MRKKWRKNQGRSFSADVIVMISGTVAAQAILIISAPIVTRLFGAEAFGSASLFTSIVGTLAIISCLRYELSIMLPETNEEAANLLALSIFFAAAIGIILIPIIWLFGGVMASILNNPVLESYLWLVPPMVFLGGAFSAVSCWNTRMRNFRRLSTTRVARAATISGTQLAGGFFGYVSGGSLIGSNVIGQLAAIAALGCQTWRSDRLLIRKCVNWVGMKHGLRRYRDFARYDVGSTLLNTISLQLPIFVLSAFFAPAVVGFYSLALMVLLLPMAFIGDAIGQVFFQRAAEASNSDKGKLSFVVGGSTKRLVAIGFLPIFILTIIGPELFVVAFGPSWYESGVYAQILTFWIFASFMTSPVSTLFAIQNKLRPLLIFSAIVLLFRAVSLLLGGMSGNVYFGLILFSLSGGIVIFIMCYWILKKSSVSPSDFVKSISLYLFLGIPLLAIVAISKYLIGFDSISLLIIGILCIILNYSAIILLDKQIRSEVLGAIGLDKCSAGKLR